MKYLLLILLNTSAIAQNQIGTSTKILPNAIVAGLNYIHVFEKQVIVGLGVNGIQKLTEYNYPDINGVTKPGILSTTRTNYLGLAIKTGFKTPGRVYYFLTLDFVGAKYMSEKTNVDFGNNTFTINGVAPEKIYSVILIPESGIGYNTKRFSFQINATYFNKSIGGGASILLNLNKYSKD